VIRNDLLRKAVLVNYTLLRAPLALLDARVVPPAWRGSVVQTSLARTIHVLDAVTGRLLGEPSPTPLPDAEREDVDRLTSDLLETEEEQTFVGELADDDLRRIQAGLRAKHSVEEREESP
jgi:hypothetical protein